MKTSEQIKRDISVGLINTAQAVIVAAATLFCGVTSARAQEPDNRIDWRWGRPGVMVVTNAPTAVTVTNIATEVAGGVANTMFGPRVSALEGALDGGTNNWDTAYGWGNHAGLYKAIGWVPSWTEVTGKPDLFDWSYDSLTDVPTTFPPEAHRHDYTAITNAPWLTSFTETDEIALSRVIVLEGKTNNWNTAYGWGNHAGLYKAIGWAPSWGDLTDIPQDFPPSTHEHDYTAVTNPPWLTEYTETDEIALSRITVLEGGTNNWNTAYGWGDHAGLYKAIGWVPSWTEVTGKPDLFDWNYDSLTNKPSVFPPSAHTHPYTDITDPPWLTSFTEQDEIALQAVFAHTNNDAIHLSAEQATRIANAVTNEQDLAALRAYHYGSPDIVESPAEWFVFDGAGTITAFNWEAGRENVVIPWEIGGVPVTTIGDGAFEGSGIVSVIAPQTVTSIGNYAFYYCTSLTSINLPQATSIGDYAFADCEGLTSVTIPQATSIGDYAFGTCYSLTSVHMGQNAPAEATDVFYGITTPPNVYVTDPQATGWGDTWNGAPVVRPPLYGDEIYRAGQLVATTQSVVEIANNLGIHTNNDAIHLSTEQAERIANAVTNEQDLAALRAYHYGSPDIVESPAEWFQFDSGTITGFNPEGGENVVIPWAIGGVPVTGIGPDAFSYRDTLTSVAIPNSVTSIGDAAFAYCYSLTSVTIGNSVTSIGDAAFAYCDSLTSVAIPNSVTSIGSITFYFCTSLTSVTIPNSVTSIGSITFSGCESLTSLYFNGNAPSIGSYIFDAITANQVTNYVTNPTATGWGEKLGGMPVVRLDLHGEKIYQAGELVATTQSVVEIASDLGIHTNNDAIHLSTEQVDKITNALTNEQDLAALRAYHYGSPDIVESPAEWFVFDAGTITAFNWEAGRTNVVIPWAIGGVPVTAIGANAFYDTDAYLGFPVTSVIAPQTVTTIGDDAFSYCGSLSSVSLPQATSIGDDAFSYCNLLTSVSLPQATAIGDGAFSSCYSLASVSLPQAQTVGAYAFSYCGSLASVSLPQATAIGDSAFGYCYSLTSVSLPQAQTVGAYAFSYCGSLASVSLPQATAIGDDAFFYCELLAAVHMGQNAPAEAIEVFADIPLPPNVYVTNPQATGWGDTWNGAPVARPPLYAEAIYQAGELVATTGHVAQAIAAITEPDLSDRPTFAQIAASNALPYTAWTGTVTPADGTATVAYAHGNMPVLVTDAPCVLTLDPTGYGTAGVSRVSLSYYTGTNSFTFATNIIDYAATPTVDTNGWNTLLIRRVSNGAWKGVGL